MYAVEISLTSALPADLKKTKYAVCLNGEELQVEISESGTEITISPIEAGSPAAARSYAHRVVNLFLDALAVQLGICSTTRLSHKYWDLSKPSSHHQVIVAGSVTVRVPSPMNLPSKVCLNAESKGGSYWRKAELAGDKFDQFRNYYLVVDSVGKYICQLEERTEHDNKVLETTLARVATDDEIKELYNALPESGNGAEVGRQEQCAAIGKLIYKDYRCSLFHSGNRGDRRPYNLEDESEIAAVWPIMRQVACLYARFEIKQAGQDQE
jgi:hypothetical protein